MAKTKTFYEALDKHRRIVRGKPESDRAFGMRMGVHPSMLRYWKKGMEPRGDTLEKILSNLDISDKAMAELASWAISDCDLDAVKQNRAAKTQEEPVVISSEVVEQERKVRCSSEFVCVPAISPQLKGQEPTLVNNNSWFQFRRDWVRTVCSTPDQLITRMVWEKDMMPILNPGDIILIDMGFFVPVDKGIYCIGQNGSVVSRRLSLLEGGNVQFSADNDPTKNQAGPLEDFNIIGRVVWLGRPLV